MTLLSIVIPVRDMSGKLGAMFDWVEEALTLDCEVILVHDYLEQSTENELTAFLGFHKLQKIKFVSSTFNSPGLARNAGLDLATGDFISFWDSDDYPQVKNFVNLAHECFDNNYEIGIGGFRTETESGIPLRTFSTKQQNNLLKIAIHPGFWRMVFRKSVLTNAQFSDLLLAEDQVFLASLIPTEKRVLFKDEIVYTYRVSQRGALTTKRNNTSDLIKALHKLLNQKTKDISRPRLEFLLVLLIRICFTIFKIGNASQRISALKIIASLVTRHFVTTVRIILAILKFKSDEKDS
jgi:glycosyltransferase involved in cell wall biosynthesis